MKGSDPFTPLHTVASVATDSHGRIEWSVAGKIVGPADANRPLEWSLVPGEHRIVARDAQDTRRRPRLSSGSHCPLAGLQARRLFVRDIRLS